MNPEQHRRDVALATKSNAAREALRRGVKEKGPHGREARGGMLDESS